MESHTEQMSNMNNFQTTKKQLSQIPAWNPGFVVFSPQHWSRANPLSAN